MNINQIQNPALPLYLVALQNQTLEDLVAAKNAIEEDIALKQELLNNCISKIAELTPPTPEPQPEPPTVIELWFVPHATGAMPADKSTIGKVGVCGNLGMTEPLFYPDGGIAASGFYSDGSTVYHVDDFGRINDISPDE